MNINVNSDYAGIETMFKNLLLQEKIKLTELNVGVTYALFGFGPISTTVRYLG